ncbi:MAG TPA: hypothetical protein VIG30_09010 [Ktedonobacterales bacterium]|jgi:hypothetical protein
MQHLTGGPISQAPPGIGGDHMGTEGARGGKPHCSICQRRLRGDIVFLDETGDVPEPRQSWMLCAACDEAVHWEMERSPVQGALRARIAVGVVAAERSPTSVHALATGLREVNWLPVLIWGFAIAMVAHLFLLVWIVSLASH